MASSTVSKEGSAPRYWSDEAYAEFYKTSTQEQRVMNSQDLPSLMRALAPPSGSATGEVPSDEQMGQFQQVFAEFSSGTEWVRASDVRQLFTRMGLSFSGAAVREILREIAPHEDNPQVHYSELCYAYTEALRHTKCAEGVGSHDKGGEADDGGLLLDEAREYLLAAGADSNEIEALLLSKGSDGLVPLSDIQDMVKTLDVNSMPSAALSPGADDGANCRGPAKVLAGEAASRGVSSLPHPKSLPKAAPQPGPRSKPKEEDSTAAAPEVRQLADNPAQAVSPEDEEDASMAELQRQLDEARAALAARQSEHAAAINTYKAELTELQKMGRSVA